MNVSLCSAIHTFNLVNLVRTEMYSFLKVWTCMEGLSVILYFTDLYPVTALTRLIPNKMWLRSRLWPELFTLHQRKCVICSHVFFLSHRLFVFFHWGDLEWFYTGLLFAGLEPEALNTSQFRAAVSHLTLFLEIYNLADFSFSSAASNKILPKIRIETLQKDCSSLQLTHNLILFGLQFFH